MKIAAALLALVATTSHAEFVSGNDLARWLGDEKLTSLGQGYIIGAADTLHGIVHCRPGNVTATQVVEIVKKNIQVFPERLHFSGDSIVTESLKQLWPCPDRKPRGERQL